MNNLFQVNILMHTAEVTCTPEQIVTIERLKKKHTEQDRTEIFGNSETSDDNVDTNKAGHGSCGNNANDKEFCFEVDNQNTDEAFQEQTNPVVFPNGDTDVEGGALWDIFRRQDVPKLQEYLQKHYKEFRHTYCSLLQQVKHP